MVLSIEKIRAEATNTVTKYGVKKVLLFGSYADGTANDDSDVDFVVEFNTAAVSLFVLSQLKYELEEKLGKQVDVIHGPLTDKSMIKADKVVSLYE